MIHMRAPTNFRRILGILSVLALLSLGTGLALFAWLMSDLPRVSSLSTHKARPTTAILDRNGKLLYELIDPDSGRQIDLTLDRVPRSCVEATLATEDSRFYSHAGFDSLAIARAAWQNYRAGGTVVSGGSTLTQQLVRILLFDNAERYQQTYRRKLREAYLAWRLERHYSKDQLLALYLNQSYYGNFAFGLEAAAQTFFAKPADQLSRAECALLAGLVQYPSGYNPLTRPDLAKARQLTVLRLMRDAGYLSQAQADTVASEPLRYRSNLFDIRAPHFVMYVQDLVARSVGDERIRQGGLRITTTLDVDLQHSAEAAVRRRLDQLNCRTPGYCTPADNRDRRVDNASALVLDAQTGEILAMVGSPDYFDESIQGNVNAALTQRQPGSAIKPFTYAVALDPGWSQQLGVEPLTAASIIADMPATFYIRDDAGGNVPYRPVNYDRRFHGPVSVRTALANSYNIPAVKLLDRIGVESLRSAAMRSGISSLTREYGLALTLGGGEVSLLDLVAAYGVFQEGHKLEPVALLDVRQQGGDGGSTSLLTRTPGPRPSTASDRVFDRETAYLITDILSDNTARIPAFGEGSVLNLPFEAAVKTGTTTDWRDNWTIGYSNQRIAGVWVGNADNEPMLGVSGIDGAGPIWRDIMTAAHRDSPPRFQPPDGLVHVEICAPSGLLPSAHCPQRRVESFIAGTEPDAMDDQFTLAVVDVRTGQLATSDTPELNRAERVVWNLPVEYRDWGEAHGIPVTPADSGSSREVLATTAPGDNSAEVLLLDSPISHTGFQIHPALPLASQRIAVRGRTADGSQWRELRLVVDGEIIAEASASDDLQEWWPLELGVHRVWVEGRKSERGPIVSSNRSYIEVHEYERRIDGAIVLAAPD